MCRECVGLCRLTYRMLCRFVQTDVSDVVKKTYIELRKNQTVEFVKSKVSDCVPVAKGYSSVIRTYVCT